MYTLLWYLIMVLNILLERKCIREEQVVGGNVKKPVPHTCTMFNVTAYDSFLSDTFSLLEDMQSLIENSTAILPVNSGKHLAVCTVSTVDF